MLQKGDVSNILIFSLVYIMTYVYLRVWVVIQ